MASTGQLGNAVANGDTRTLEIYHTHTKETVAITYKRNGSYERTGLDKLNWALRDWRRDEPTKMDPRLFDIAWEVHRAVGSQEPLHVVSAYRAPETNAMLRRRSRGVAKHSQHMEGKAMDFYLPDVSMAKVREIGLRMQRGGVGYYPSSANSFVHLDAGSVRHWPRMPRDQLARLFPDGKTVHIPADGKPMPGYDLAAAEIEAGGGSVTAYASDEGGLFSTRRGKSFFAALFGGADEEEDIEQAKPAPRQVARRDTGQQPQQQLAAVSLGGGGDDYGRPVFFANTSIRPSEPVPAAAPRRVVAPAPTPEPAAAPASVPDPAPAPQQVAALQPRQVWQTGPAGSTLDAVSAVTPGTAIPLPLARPTDIGGLTAYANVPLPPTRPVEIATLGAGTAAVLAAQPVQPPAAAAVPPAPPAPAPLVYANVPLPPPRPALPGGATIIAAARPATPPATTATAAAPAAAPARSAADDLTPGMMDRAALRALFANAAIGAPSGGPERTVVATAKARPAERDLTGLTGRPAAAVAGGFAAAPAADMRTDRFTGPAVKAVPVQRFTP
ncbi:MAG: DUF882 domain-containing protein [Burkholderiales bacterium]|nr:DUF882 domain-containing protein [Burkholderiales bacterium]